MSAATTIPLPTAIPAIAPLPSCTLLEELFITLLLEDDDGEGDEPPVEELLPADDPADDIVAVTAVGRLVTGVLDPIPVETLLKDVTDVPPIWLTFGKQLTLVICMVKA
jgi:hypothetical protein